MKDFIFIALVSIALWCLFFILILLILRLFNII